MAWYLNLTDTSSSPLRGQMQLELTKNYVRDMEAGTARADSIHYHDALGD